MIDSDAIRARFGAAAAAAFPNVDPRHRAVVHVDGPFAWVEVGPPTLTIHDCYFFGGGAWRKLEGLEAFRQAIIEARPPLADWKPIIDAYTRITRSDPLNDRADVEDLQDVRWHLLPWSAEQVAAWKPPHFDGHVLRFCVNDHGRLGFVSVQAESYAVEVSLW